MRTQFSWITLFCVVACTLVACGENSKNNGGTGEPAVGGAGGSEAGPSSGGGGAATLGTNIGGSGFNQCGVAAPMPVDTGKCSLVSEPIITTFDDYTGGAAANYSYYVNGAPTSPSAVRGAVLHVDDGSSAGDAGTSIVATEMVTGEGGTGYALEFSDTNATHWGGLLMFYFPSPGTCLNGSSYQGVQFSIRGTCPSGRFGVNLGMLDTISTSDNGLCNNTPSNGCKDATVELSLPVDAETWQQIQIPWDSFTPGVGSALSCVPVTGQNVVRLVIQPFMNYPPPNYDFEPGLYEIAIDNVKFF